MATELNHLLAMTCRAKPATSTTEGEKILMVTIGAVCSGKTLLKITTFQVLPNYLGNYRAEEAILTREKIVVPALELIKMMIE